MVDGIDQMVVWGGLVGAIVAATHPLTPKEQNSSCPLEDLKRRMAQRAWRMREYNPGAD